MSVSDGDQYVRDIEAQQEHVLLTASGHPPRERLRQIILILRACLVLISRADQAQKAENSEVVETFEDLPNDSTVSTDDELQRANIDRIVKEKDIGSLRAFGGVQVFAEALDIDLEKGIPVDEDDLHCRKPNTLCKPRAPTQGFLRSLSKSCNNHVIFLLSLSAVMSIGFGIKEKGLRTGWCEGAIIILAIIILVVLSSGRNFWNQKYSKRLPEDYIPSEKKQLAVDVLRGGSLQKINISDVVTGEIVHLKMGNKVPGDGLFISGNVKILYNELRTVDEANTFLHDGGKVVEGNGQMLVTSVGMNEKMSQVTEAPRITTTAAQLDKLSTFIQIAGLLMSIFIPIVVFLHFIHGKQKHDNGVPEIKGKPNSVRDFMDAIKRVFTRPGGQTSNLATSLAMMVVGIVEGVPAILSLAIICWNKKTLDKYKAFAQESLACVNMGSVTTICTDKDGGLTLNQQEVGMCYIGVEAISEDSVIHRDVLQVLCEGISADVMNQQSPGNSAEDPIIPWATLTLGLNMDLLKQSCSIVDPNGVQRSDGGGRVLFKKNKDGEGNMHLHLKGTAEFILAKCSFYYERNGTIEDMTPEKLLAFEQIINDMNSKCLETTAFACKPVESPESEDNRLRLIGLLGLKRVCRRETREALRACRNAGVNVILISEDNVSVLTTIGRECGLLSNSSGRVLEGEEFRNLSDEERMKIVNEICIIGNCLPSDKFTLVQCLKQRGHRVAMVGVRRNETPALKEANVGIAMGPWSSELARESSDIFIQDGNFSSLSTILRCGRCMYNNIQKYIQLHLTMVIAGLLVIAITTAASGDSPFTAIQWCWVTQVVAVSAAIALFTEQSSEKLLESPPIGQTDALITKTMWRNIIAQALYQAAILVTFQFKGQSILRINGKVTETMIFNSFAFCQIFNQFNARELEMKNVFRGINRNIWFWVAVSVALLVQVMFTKTAHILAGDAKLNRKEWSICFLIGILSLAIDLAAKTIYVGKF